MRIAELGMTRRAMLARRLRVIPQSAIRNPQSKMLLIDGYNLLHATDLFGSGKSAGTLEGSRDALLAFLADRLTPRERRQTTIVFDAAGAPPGLPDRMAHEGIEVRYSRGYADADTLIEELIESMPGPKGLTVVSSDHRVQRAARSRGAKYIDSDTWHSDLRRRQRATGSAASKPLPGQETESAEFWVDQFADEELLDTFAQQDAKLRRGVKKPAPPADRKKPKSKRPTEKPQQAFGEGLLDPFPPGYADDLAKELGRDTKGDSE